jgi:type IV pilus assembly protein PilX
VQTTQLEQRASGNELDHQLALQAAEAGLRVGEGGVLQDLWTNYPVWSTSSPSSNTGGTYSYDAVNAPATPLWQMISNAGMWVYSSTSQSSKGVMSYTEIIGSQFSSQVAQDPLFVVEELPPVANPGQNIGAAQYGADTPTITVYRITALGTGGDMNSQVMLQSIMHQ